MMASNTWKCRRTSPATSCDKIVSRVEHGEHDSLYGERRVVAALDPVDRGHQVGEPLERVVLALQRHDHAIGGDQRIEREQPQRRRAIDEHVLVTDRVRDRARQRLTQALGAIGQIDELDLGAREILRRGDHIERGDVGLHDDVGQRRLADQRLVETALAPCAAGSPRRSRRCPAGRRR